MTARLKLNRWIKLYVTFILICAIECGLAFNVSADVDKIAHWPVEVAENWNSVYGRVSNLIVQDGDSVGMFDAEGNCYGASLVKEGHYFLSAFMREEAKSSIDGDFTIPGFEEGDIVVFKAYKESTAEEYILTPANGIPYTYAYKGNYPPVRIDLVYAEDTSSLSGLSENIEPSMEDDWASGWEDDYENAGESSTGGTVVLGGYPSEDPEWLAEEDKIGTEATDENQELLREPEQVEKRIVHEEEATSIRDEKREPFYEEPYEEYEPTDYYERRNPSRIDRSSRRTADKPSEYTAQAGISELSLPLSKEKKMGEKIVVAKEAVTTKTPHAETAAHEMEPMVREVGEDHLPLIALIASMCAGFVIILILVSNFKPYTVKQI